MLCYSAIYFYLPLGLGVFAFLYACVGSVYLGSFNVMIGLSGMHQSLSDAPRQCRTATSV